MPNAYHAYGLILESELALPELAPASGPADISLRLAALEPVPARSDDPWYAWQCEGAETRLSVRTVATVLLREGREILVDPDPGVGPGRLRDFLLSFVLGALLQQRGALLLLHASSVLIDGRAVVFVGESGEGKSTMTAALHARGYPVVSDELVPLELSGEGLRVWPAFSRLKLMPEAAEALGCPSEALAEISKEEEKLAWQVAAVAPGVALPLARIYLLRSGDAHSVQPAPALDAAGELLRQCFHKRLLPPERLQQHFLASADLARSGYVHLLTRRRSLAELGTVAALVEADVRTLA